LLARSDAIGFGAGHDAARGGVVLNEPQQVRRRIAFLSVDAKLDRVFDALTFEESGERGSACRRDAFSDEEFCRVVLCLRT
jgi:hypothetical protein